MFFSISCRIYEDLGNSNNYFKNYFSFASNRKIYWFELKLKIEITFQFKTFLRKIQCSGVYS